MMESENVFKTVVVPTPVEILTGDLARLKAALIEKRDKDFEKGEVWQAILNLGYGKWQSLPEGSGWSYKDMIDWVALEYGFFAQVCVLLGKYNQQVLCNGHMGYWDNGYAGGRPGNPDSDIPLHRLMLRLMRRVRVDRIFTGKKIYDIASRFKIETWQQSEILSDPSVDGDYANAAQYNGRWEREFNDVIRRLIEQSSPHQIGLR